MFGQEELNPIVRIPVKYGTSAAAKLAEMC